MSLVTCAVVCGVEQKRDVELVRQIRHAIGPELNICVDANQGYPTAKAAVKITKAMEEYNLLYMEQPVEGIDQMAEVARRVDTPIMADESAWTAQDVIEIIQKKAADVISIYTTKPGGMFKGKKIDSHLRRNDERRFASGLKSHRVCQFFSQPDNALSYPHRARCPVPVSTTRSHRHRHTRTLR